MEREQMDFSVIRARVTMQMILDHYGIRNLKTSSKTDELRGACPIHNSGRSDERCFQVNTAKNIFHCFHCKAGGNVIDFVAKLEGCNLREAGLKLRDWYNLNGTAPKEQESTPAPEQHPDDVRDLLAAILDELKSLNSNLTRVLGQGRPEG